VSAQRYEEVVVPYPSASFIKEQPGIFRVMPMLHLRNNDEKNPLPVYTNTFLRPESNMIYGIMTPEGYRSLYLERYADIMALLVAQPSGSLKAKLCEFNNLDDNILDFLNVKYIVASRVTSKKFTKGYRLVYEDKLHKIFLNENALERAFVVHNIKIIKQKEEILKTIASGLDFSKVAIIEEDSLDFDMRTTNASSDVLIEKYQPNEIFISVNNNRDGFLVLLDCYYPGWKAYLDDKPTKIFRANYIFRAVRVPQGRHRIKFIYSPDSLKIGFMISSAVFLFSLVLCIFLRKKKFPYFLIDTVKSKTYNGKG